MRRHHQYACERIRQCRAVLPTYDMQTCDSGHRTSTGNDVAMVDTRRLRSNADTRVATREIGGELPMCRDLESIEQTSLRQLELRRLSALVVSHRPMGRFAPGRVSGGSCELVYPRSLCVADVRFN